MRGNLFAKETLYVSSCKYIYIEYVFPYREYNTSSKKSKLVCNFCVYCITYFGLFLKKRDIAAIQTVCKLFARKLRHI